MIKDEDRTDACNFYFISESCFTHEQICRITRKRVEEK